MEGDTVGHPVETRNLLAFLVVSGIAARYQHDSNGTARILDELPVAQIALSHPFEQVYQVGLDAQHHHSGSPIRTLYSMTMGSPPTLMRPRKMKPL